MTTISAEQMPGGRAQISARTLAGDQQFLSPQLPNYREAIDMLEKFRLFCGGELAENPADAWIAARANEARMADEAESLAESEREKALRTEADLAGPVWSPPMEPVSA